MFGHHGGEFIERADGADVEEFPVPGRRLRNLKGARGEVGDIDHLHRVRLFW